MSKLEKFARWTLLRNTALVAVVVPAVLFAGCAQQPAPPPQPVASTATYTPPAPPPPPPPAPVTVGERG